MMEETAVKNATYPPSWMNRFTSWVKRLPIPAWLFTLKNDCAILQAGAGNGH